MTLEFNRDKEVVNSVNNGDAFRNQLFNVGDKAAFNINDTTDHAELIANHDRLAEEITAHAERIASAAFNTVNSLPAEHQKTFWAGVPEKGSKASGPVYDALWAQLEKSKGA